MPFLLDEHDRFMTVMGHALRPGEDFYWHGGYMTDNMESGGWNKFAGRSK